MGDDARLSRLRARLAIDGPAASGKSALGSAVAAQLGFPFIDTGGIYRALTWLALSQGISPTDAAALTDLAAHAAISIRQGATEPSASKAASVTIDGLDATPHLRSAAVEQAVSTVSAIAGVRSHLIAIQRALAQERAVMAGRDIGSVVLPDAELKVFLDASPEERARRRQQEHRASGEPADYQEQVEQMRRRDFLDSTRAVAPLRPAPDALRLFTDEMPLRDVVEKVLDLARERWPELALPSTKDNRSRSPDRARC